MADDENNDPEHTASKEEEDIQQKPDPVAELGRKVEDLTDTLKRLQAEFENYKKRVAKEWTEKSKTAAEGLVRDLLAVLDTFDKALENRSGNKAEGHDERGLSGIQKQLFQILQMHGVREVKTDGKFDPFEHEALMRTESQDVEDGKILEVYQKGYILGGKVIRPARVKVAKRIEPAEEADDDHDNQYDEESEPDDREVREE